MMGQAAIVKEKKIPLEVCLLSSELAAMVENASLHPGLDLYRSGHSACIATDDPSLFGQSLSEELYRWAQIIEVSVSEVAELQNRAWEM